MNLDKFSISNCIELIDLTNINNEEFYKIIEIVASTFERININPKDKKIYYQRNSDATSILAIQVMDGSDSDINNYLFNGCEACIYGSNVNCDVYIHSKAKSGQNSSKLVNLISRDIIQFFEKTEEELLKNNNFNLSLSLMMPIDIKKEKEQRNIKKFVKSIFKKH